MKFILGYVLLLIAVAYSFKHPRAALFGLVATDYIRPQGGEDPRVFNGFEAVKFSLVLNALALVLMVAQIQKYKLKWEPFHGRMILLFLCVVNSAVFAFRPDLAWPRVYDYFLTFMQYVFICAFIRTMDDLRKLYWAIGLSISLVALRYCYGKFGLAEYGWEGPTGDRNELAMMMVMALPFLFVLSLTATSLSARLFSLVAIAPVALTIVFSLSRGGFLGLAAVGLYILFRLHHKRWLVGLAIVGVLAGLSMVPPEFYERIGTVRTAANDDASSRGRINAWHAAVAMAQDRPLTGVGVGNFLVRFARYAPDRDDVHVAHSSFFQILGDTGLPGTIVWLSIVGGIWFAAARTEKRLKQRDRGRWTDERYFVLALKAAWFGFVICGAFLSQEDWDFLIHLLGIAGGSLVFAALPAAVSAASEAAPGSKTTPRPALA